MCEPTPESWNPHWPPAGPFARLLAHPFIWLILLYRATLSVVMGRQCRFEPTCSAYGLQAYRTYGAWFGTLLTVRRIVRCRPWGGSGYDPVPVPRSDE